MAQTVALNSLQFREATGARCVGLRRFGEGQNQSLREIADPTNQGSTPASPGRICSVKRKLRAKHGLNWYRC